MKWYYKLVLIYFIMFILSSWYFGFENGLIAILLIALMATAIFSPLFFIDYTSKTSIGQKEGTYKKLTWKQWLLLGLIVIAITFIIIFSIFLFVF